MSSVPSNELDHKGWPDYEELKAQIERQNLQPLKTSIGWGSTETRIWTVRRNEEIWRKRVHELTRDIEYLRRHGPVEGRRPCVLGKFLSEREMAEGESTSGEHPGLQTDLIEAVRYVLEAEDMGCMTTTYPVGHSPMVHLRRAFENIITDAT
jgi:hypothetical protein